MRKIVFVFISFVCAVLPLAGQQADDNLLDELDETIKSRDIYAARREGVLNNLKEGLVSQTDLQEKYKIYSRLFDEYRSFQSDTAIVYAEKKLKLAQKLKEEAKMDDSRLNLAEIYAIIGLYKESLDMLESIDRARLNEALVPYYYHIHCTAYKYMNNFAVTHQQRALYYDRLNSYCDSLVNAEKVGTNSYVFAKANYLMQKKDYKNSFMFLHSNYQKQDPLSRDISVYAYLMALNLEQENDKMGEKHYLIISATSDLKSGIKEYISLRRLAYLLYLDGDIDRAYSYMKVAMEDAIFCNSHMRMMEVSQILPIINNDYQIKKQKQNRQLFFFLVSISLLSLLLLLGIVYIYKQMKRINVARRQLKETNKELQEANMKLEEASRLLRLNVSSLEQFNNDMQEMNSNLKEANCIKETYIIRYMDLCSEYLDKIEIYLKRLKKLAVKGDLGILNNELNPTEYITENLNLFYNNFDLTFLNLFPSFVEDFNKLLKDDSRIELKGGELLNPELRIYALVRLGIADNINISRFLRYSLSTIYNYRTQVRKKALSERSEFEKKVMTIGVDIFSGL
ncbi:DUF6377 domain-containing protein [Dysgonomonas sp. BGC7]|uniref:DUF6377 domain-containing protein n=1 Tax=Dysgonomonas sp. BGC7 TaxID=1658008 RepID=UPI00067FE26F|nr:DUF6377 domain-containing protein [Dysgonomonas sp. BGC7]MBD8390367.1 hypothetical protein [Dysgonomonas sp. BGC7]